LNGDYLQILTRLFTMTGDRRFLAWARRLLSKIARAYFKRLRKRAPKYRSTVRPARSQAALRVVHVTFGDDRFRQSLSRLRRSAKRVGIDDIRIYSPHHPAVRRAAEENPEIMNQRRGAGYWLWKPYILLDTIDTVEEGSVVVYTDAGHRYIAEPSRIIELATRQAVVLFHSAGNVQRHWTKRDCFVLMQADKSDYWNARQLDASIQIYRAGATARRFLLGLQDAMRDPRILCDWPNTCGLPNFRRFRDHRHDQSILTNLAIKQGIKTFPSPKIVVRATANSKRSGHSRQDSFVVFEHHRLRNAPLGTYWRRVVKDLLA
jgi:hypothetical protein